MREEMFASGKWDNIHFEKKPYDIEKFMVYNQEFGEIAIVNFHVGSDGETEKANAHLISVAPEMYQRLKGVRCFLWTMLQYESQFSVYYKQIEHQVKEIDKVLKKARGEK